MKENEAKHSRSVSSRTLMDLGPDGGVFFCKQVPYLMQINLLYCFIVSLSNDFFCFKQLKWPQMLKL